jgi:uncharacterized protein
MQAFSSIGSRGRLAGWLLTAVWLGVGATAAAAEQPRGIAVTGAGEVLVVPDMARVSLEVRREGQDAAAMKSTLDQVTAEVLAFTERLNIPRRDVTAAAVNIYPRYRHHPTEQPRVDGIIAVRTIEVTLRDLAQIGELINGALERGVNGVSGVQLDAQNRIELERQALDLAIDDAVREARQVARRFEVGVGPLLHAATSQHHVRPLMMEAAAMRTVAKDSFEPGELTIRREVQATFDIAAP